MTKTAQLLFGIAGKSLTAEEKRWLKHPLAAGVILFTRNYDNPQQIKALIKQIRQTATDDILVAVDHEGGRVQRFREGFSTIPPMAVLGKMYDQAAQKGLDLARATGYVLAYEVGQCDIDLSFSPVLDVQTPFSAVIGDRAFHADVDKVAKIASAFYTGMKKAGLAGVGKHFPGHGNVVADSHLELPIHHADWASLQKTDLPPFKKLIGLGIEAIMPAHIRYPLVDDFPAGFSKRWLKDILRHQLGFTGCIVSDDLDMAGAAAYGGIESRLALAAENCDLILLCNNVAHIKIAFETRPVTKNPLRQKRLDALKRDPKAASHETYLDALSQMREGGLIG